MKSHTHSARRACDFRMSSRAASIEDVCAVNAIKMLWRCVCVWMEYIYRKVDSARAVIDHRIGLIENFIGFGVCVSVRDMWI